MPDSEPDEADQLSDHAGKPAADPPLSKHHIGCKAQLIAAFRSHGVAIAVSDQPSRARSSRSMTCPHGHTYWFEIQFIGGFSQ